MAETTRFRSSTSRSPNFNSLTAAEYRARYGLESDYPMTAPNYSATRRAMAKKFGLGSKGRQAKAADADADAPAPTTPAKRGRFAKEVQPA
jgi:predicted transcriptional regulator